MPTVPREYGPTVQAKPINTPLQSTQGANVSAFGNTGLNSEGVQRAAANIGQIGTEMAKVQARIQERNDVVARAREFGGFNTFATESLTALQSTGDIADPNTVKGYATALDEKINEIVTNHSGSEESRAVLAARLNEQRSSILDQAAVTSAAAGRKAVSDQMGVEMNQLASQVGSGALRFDEAVATWNEHVNEFAPSLQPEEERALRAQGPAAFVNTSFDNILMQPNGDLEAMKLLQTSPGLMGLLTPPEQRDLTKRIQMVAQANAAERNKVITLGQGQVAYQNGKVIARGPAAPVAQTLSQKVDEAEKAIGRKLTDRETTILGSFYAAETEAETPDLESDSGTVFSSLAERYAKGETTPLEDREFEFAVTNYTQPTVTMNQDTGLAETRRNALPDYVKKAITARGRIQPPDEKETEGPAAAGGQPQGGEQGAAQGQIGPTKEAAAAQPQQAQASSEREPTIFELSPKVTGPEAATKQAISKAPFVPGNFPQETEAKSYVETELRNLVVALQNSKGYAEGERKALEEELDLKGAFFDDPGAYQDRIVGIDKALENREQEALKRAADPKTTRELRQRSLDIVQLIGDFRKKLAPPRFDTPDELKEYLAGNNDGGPVLVKRGEKYELRYPKPAAKPEEKE